MFGLEERRVELLIWVTTHWLCHNASNASKLCILKWSALIFRNNT